MYGLGFLHKYRQTGIDLKRTVDRLALTVGLFSSTMILPQVWTIASERQAEGVALPTWAAFAAASLFWLTYGLIHREKPLIITFGLGFILQLAVVILTLIYR